MKVTASGTTMEALAPREPIDNAKKHLTAQVDRHKPVIKRDEDTEVCYFDDFCLSKLV